MWQRGNQRAVAGGQFGERSRLCAWRGAVGTGTTRHPEITSGDREGGEQTEVIRTVGIAHVPTGLATGGRHLGHHWTAPKGSGHVHVAAGPDHHRGGPETVATVCVGDSGD